MCDYIGTHRQRYQHFIQIQPVYSNHCSMWRDTTGRVNVAWPSLSVFCDSVTRSKDVDHKILKRATSILYNLYFVVPHHLSLPKMQ